MPINWIFAEDIISIGGVDKYLISSEDAERQAETAKVIIEGLRTRPGILLADEVGMGKTYVAMAVIASVIAATRHTHCPVVVMVPPGLRQKWQRDWEQFKTHCVRDHALDWVRDRYAHTPAEFFKLLDDPRKKRANIIFMTTGCFSRGLYDPWVKLAMVRLARRFTKLTDSEKRHLYRWSGDLVRQYSNYKLTENVVRKLMHEDVLDWKGILVAEDILTEEDDDPVPERLQKEAYRIDWKPLCEILHRLPGWRPAYVRTNMRKEIRRAFSHACRLTYEQWLNLARWRSPLLVLDEAHHAKNDATRLAKLFRQESEDDVVLLKNKFDRMLFLTATPFQLGHQELIRVLRSFAAIRWISKEAPAKTCKNYMATMIELEHALDQNRLAGRRFDQRWGKLRLENISTECQDNNCNGTILDWWNRLEKSSSETWEGHLLQSYHDCMKTKKHAEQLLRPWLIRHNRTPFLPDTVDIPRRNVFAGKAILTTSAAISSPIGEGLPIEQNALLPFLITAKAQGELTKYKRTRALFAEGLVSSYEAFHHTRDKNLDAKDKDDGLAVDSNDTHLVIPTSWYEKQISRFIPTLKDDRIIRMLHPKISATVEKAVNLWLAGEKVLLFCFYIKTANALLEHIQEEINNKIIDIAGNKFGLDFKKQRDEIQNLLARIIRRLRDSDSPFHKEITKILTSLLLKPKYRILEKYRAQLLGVLMAYFRSPSFIIRYLPLDDPLIRNAFAQRVTNRDVITRGIDALRHAILERKDASDQTFRTRIDQFLDFTTELAERAKRLLLLRKDESSEESVDPLLEYLDAISVYSKPRKLEHIDVDDDIKEDNVDDGSYRVMRIVRKVIGETKIHIRDRLMLAFNSPLFPEVLISSSVMGEGVDLHRFCRYIIHHDLCWNPSTLEQRTGRLDRVRCKAEVCKRSIEIYEPFLAGSADEKMYRVLRDRERWFQIVMGQKYEFDELTSDSIACRIPLPHEIGDKLTFDLSRWRRNR